MIGQQLAHYKIVEKIGSGGMGDVYRADDTKLGRPVAIKVLPSEMADDPTRKARFEREARAIAALKHPNIVTIYSVEEANGTHFITMELVEGQTLSALIPKGGFSLEQFLDFSVSLADAVSGAHDKGITHRDLKPANVMLDADGRLKVLDFGLAKLLDKEDEQEDDKTVADSDTAEGMVLGTVSYMSPEQAEGKEIDHRSDIFSLGVILYEMATGKRPFEGDTRISTISSILRDEPTPVTEVKALPRHLGRIVKRCLSKQANRRYQSAIDLRNDLEELKEEVQSGETLVTGAMPAYVEAPRRPKWILPVAAAGVVALAALAFVMLRPSGEAPISTAPAPASNMEMVPITTNGRSDEATISADGRYVCYVQENEKDGESLRVTQVATGSAVEIIPAQDGVFLWDPSFSPDGDFIYFVRLVRGPDTRPALYRIPVLGGSAQLVKEHVNGRVSFSPDASEYVFIRFERGSAEIIVAATAGGDERVIAARTIPKLYSNDPVWSPDGNTIAVSIRDLTEGITAGIATIPAEGGQETVFATDERWTDVEELSWLPDGSGLIAQIEQSFINDHIWEVGYPGGAARKVTSDLNSYSGVETTADGTTLVTMQMQRYSNVWRIVDGGEPEQLTNVRIGSAASDIEWFPDGRLIYNTNLGGNWDLGVMSMDGSSSRRITSDLGVNVQPCVSPDGTHVLFVSDRSGAFNVWKMRADGSGATRMTSAPFAVEPEWTGNDSFVFISMGDEPGMSLLYSMSADGGEARKLSDRIADNPAVSPDGKRVMFSAVHEGDNRNMIDVLNLETGEVEQSVFIQSVEEFFWSPDGTAIHYSRHHDGVDNIWSQPLAGGEPTRLTNFTDSDILSVRWSRDGKTLALARGEASRDIVLIKNFR